jgi:hypothetical protein
VFYPCDYEIKLTKEREIQERVERAATQRLLLASRQHRPGNFQRLARAALHGLGHLLLSIGKVMEQTETNEPTLTQPSVSR